MSEKNIKKLLIGELFCGPGGLASGAFEARISNGEYEWEIEHSWANDMSDDACRSFALNFCRTSDLNEAQSVVCEDVRNLAEDDFASLEEIAVRKAESLGRDSSSRPFNLVDVIAFGFPCNDFSIVGEHKGFDGNYGPLYTYGVGVLNKFRPQAFVAENVGGMASANNGSALKAIINDLSKAGNGYRLTAHKYRFENYGVPQKRHRIIIVGIDKKAHPNLRFLVPYPTHEIPVTAGEALKGLTAGDESFHNNELTAQSKQVVERLMHTESGENAWTADLPPHLKLNVKGARLSQIYKRLRKDEPSYTITGSGGGGTHVYHWSEPRALTNRERARLQTFRDSFIFVGSKENVRKQIGMAVPRHGAKLIFEALLMTLAGIKYPIIPASLNVEEADGVQMEMFSEAQV